MSVLLETYQCGTNAPLQSVFACVLLRSNETMSPTWQDPTVARLTRLPQSHRMKVLRAFAQLCDCTPKVVGPSAYACKVPHIEAFILITRGGLVTRKAREYPLCVPGDGVQVFAENHVHRFSACTVCVLDDFRHHPFEHGTSSFHSSDLFWCFQSSMSDRYTIS